MKALIIYDSYFGNTEKIAQAIGAAFNPQECAGVVRATELKPEQLQNVDLIIAGSPTRAFRPSEGLTKALNGLPAGALQGKKVAAFDTRINPDDTNSGFLRFMVKLFGYAAKPIAGMLKKKGGSLVQQPEGFYVKDSEGPLKDGELERAARWAQSLRQ